MVRFGFRKLSLCACALGLVWGCSKAPTPEASKAEAGKDTPKAAPSEAATESKSDAAPAAAADLGERFRDPTWFRRDGFPGAKVVKFGRTEADGNGLFASQLLLEFDGTDVNACVEKIRGVVEPHVPGLEPTEEPNGRITLKGTTDRYEVTLVCGAVEGKTKAYVGYRWLK